MHRPFRSLADWAPQSNTKTSSGTLTFSKGIVRSVYLVAVPTAAIAHLQALVSYRGPYPTAPLTDAAAGPWSITVRVHIMCTSPVQGIASAVGSWTGAAPVTAPVSLPAGDSVTTLTLLVAAGAVQLWWPAGLGAQPLYTVNASFAPSTGAAVLTSRVIGFRAFALVTDDDSDPAKLAGLDGSGNLTMRFKVNGADIWSRGANMIPMEELEGRTDAAALARLVMSAREGGMNTLRVWGGGIFLPDAFYDAADSAGLLLYHDMMYAQQGHAPAVSAMQDAEIRHQVRRLSSHPSLAVWDSCNECGGSGIYASFVMAAIVAEDSSRPPWPACPSKGWDSGVDRLWGLPNGSPAGLSPRAMDDNGDAASVRALGAPTQNTTSAAAAAAAAGAACPPGANASCQFVANLDIDNGSIGPHFPADSPAACCDLCAAASPSCWSASK